MVVVSGGGSSGTCGGGSDKLVNNFIITSNSHLGMTYNTTTIGLIYPMYMGLIRLNRIYDRIFKI